MAQPVTYNGSKLYVSLGDGAGTEVFTAPCGLTTRGVTFTKETNDTTVPDCADPDLPAWTQRGVRAFAAEFTGSGVLAAAALPSWRDFYLLTASRNVRVGINAPAVDEGGYWLGKAHMTNFAVTGELGDKIQVSVTIVNDGAWTWVDAT